MAFTLSRLMSSPCTLQTFPFIRLSWHTKLVAIKYFSSSCPRPSDNVFESAYNLSSSVSPDDPTVLDLYEGIKAQKRAALARGITLVESTHPRKQAMAQMLLDKCLHYNHEQQVASKKPQTFRIGLSGPPGAGKSTFIECFGNLVTDPHIKLTEDQVSIAGRKRLPVDVNFATSRHKVAVLAVDPSSPKTGGSLLGDKTRMLELTRNPNAYIRPSPSGGTLGGVSRNTSESMKLCETAGFDVILVETMGVGQAEFAVADMVDMFCLILPPAGGDELQGMKRGIMEMADVVIVNKCDGELVQSARRVATEYTSALKFMRPRFEKWTPRVHMVSSKEGSGMEDLWLRMCQFRQCLLQSGAWMEQRRQQRVMHLWTQLKENIFLQFQNNPKVKSALAEVEREVLAGNMSPGLACDYLLQLFRQKD